MAEKTEARERREKYEIRESAPNESFGNPE